MSIWDPDHNFGRYEFCKKITDSDLKERDLKEIGHLFTKEEFDKFTKRHFTEHTDWIDNPNRRSLENKYLPSKVLIYKKWWIFRFKTLVFLEKLRNNNSLFAILLLFSIPTAVEILVAMRFFISNLFL